MKKVVKLLCVFALAITVGLTSCSDDGGDSKSCENGTFDMTLDGVHFTGKSFNNTLLKATDGGTPGKRVDIRATDASGLQVIITFTDLTTGTTGDGVSTDEYISFEEVMTGDENVFLFTIIDGQESYFFTEGSLDITSCDAANKQVSGTFSFTDGDIEVTNGSFTNMCYTILQ